MRVSSSTSRSRMPASYGKYGKRGWGLSVRVREEGRSQSKVRDPQTRNHDADEHPRENEAHDPNGIPNSRPRPHGLLVSPRFGFDLFGRLREQQMGSLRSIGDLRPNQQAIT